MDGRFERSICITTQRKRQGQPRRNIQPLAIIALFPKEVGALDIDTGLQTILPNAASSLKLNSREDLEGIPVVVSQILKIEAFGPQQRSIPRLDSPSSRARPAPRAQLNIVGSRIKGRVHVAQKTVIADKEKISVQTHLIRQSLAMGAGQTPAVDWGRGRSRTPNFFIKIGRDQMAFGIRVRRIPIFS